MSAPIPFGTEFLANTTTAMDQQFPVLATLADGRFVMAWSDWSQSGDDSSASAVRARIFAADGTGGGAEILVNTTTQSMQQNPSVAVLSDGRFVLAWSDWSQTGGDTDGMAVRAQVFTADGAKAGPELLVNATTTLNQQGPTIAPLSDGRFVIAWEDHSQTGGDTDGAAVRAQIFAADGSKAGGEFLVNTTTAGWQGTPRIAALSEGRFIATWMDGGEGQHHGMPEDPPVISGLRAQIFAADGAKLGGEMMVKANAGGFVQETALTSLPDGGFALAWVLFTPPDFDEEDEHTGEDPHALYRFDLQAQIFTASGARVGAEIVIAPESSAWRSSPAISALPDGRIVVAWGEESQGEGSSGSTIRAQVFSAQGDRLGTDFQVNTTVSGWRGTPQITPLPEGRFVVGWTDWSQTGGDESGSAVRGQIFDVGSLVTEAPFVRIYSTRDLVEGDSGTRAMSFVVERFGDLSEALTVTWTAEGAGSFPADAQDVAGGLPQGGSLSFAPGESSAAITLQIRGDTTIEPVETLRVTLTGATTASGQAVTISNAQGFGRILDDDTPPPPPPPLVWGRTWGDPHLVTLDGLGYSFQAVGEFILLESTAGDPLSVQIRTVPLTDLVSVISAVATQMGDVRVMIDGSRSVKLLVDGEPTTVTAGSGPLAVGGGQIFFNNDTWTLVQANGEQLQVNVMEDGFLNVAVALSETRSPGSLRGLLGNGDGSTGNDLALRDGTVLSQPVSFADLYGRYADSWRISEAETLFHRAAGETTADHQDPSYPRGQLAAEDLPPDLYAAALAAVTAAGITDPMLRDAAILDYALTGQFGFINAAASGGAPPTEIATPVDAPALPTMLTITAPGARPEGNAGTATPVIFTIGRLGDSSTALSVGYTLGGDIDTDDIESPFAGTVHFAPGETERSVTIMVRGDDLPEGDERLVMTLIDDEGEEILFASRSATTIILNDDGPMAAAPTGSVVITGTPERGASLRADTSTIGDANGLGAFSYQWFADGLAIEGATSDSFTPGLAEVGSLITVRVSYTDGIGTAESLTSMPTPAVLATPVMGTGGDDRIIGLDGPDTIYGLAGNDRLEGGAGDDLLHGGPGNDTLVGGAGNDTLMGDEGANLLNGVSGNNLIHGGELRDLVYGGTGHDTIHGNDGNDELRGLQGDDLIFGGLGSDTIIGNEGNDTLEGGGLSDLIFGGDGDDFINGGWGFDRLNGGAGADTFFHLGIRDHGSDWIQDYSAAEGDVLQFGLAGAARGDFLVQYAHTADAAGVRSGNADVAEAFVTYRPSGQIIWALVDGEGQDSIMVRSGPEIFDLLG